MNIDLLIQRLEHINRLLKEPVISKVAQSHDPFKVLVSTILSLRTKDDTTYHASVRFFNVIQTPEDVVKLDVKTIEKLIYPVGFYKIKAKNIKAIAGILVIKYNARVPATLDELLLLPNVGRKTANLVLSKCFDKPAICVDIHVHRISNRIGILKSKTPYETELKLQKVLPKKYWSKYNDLLVPFGQNICKPISPFCSNCIIYDLCKRVNVIRSR